MKVVEMPGSRRRRKRKGRVKGLGRALDLFLKKNLSASFPFMLVRLWRNWEEVVGPEAAELAKPMGHSNDILIVGAEDSATLNELTYYAPEILDAVNAFLGEIYFDKVQGTLLMGRVPLNEITVLHPPDARVKPRNPGNLGGMRERFAPDSPVLKCYEKYVALIEGEGERILYSRKESLKDEPTRSR